MAVNLSMLAGAGAQFFDNNGIPLAGGLVYTYAAGTTTPQATYTTSAGSIAHANPIVLDSAGRTPSGGEIWLTDAVAYKFVLKTSGASTIGTYDNVTGNSSGIYAAFAASSGSSLVGYTQGSTNAVATTVQGKLRQTVSVIDFGASTSNTAAQNSTAFANALAYIVGTAQKGVLIIPSGTYNLNSTLTVNITYVSLAGQAATLNFPTLSTGAAILITATNPPPTELANAITVISGLTISGNSTATPTIGIQFNAIGFAIAHFSIDNCNINNFGVGESFQNNSYLIHHKDVVVWNCNVGIQNLTGFSNNGENISYVGGCITGNYVNIVQNNGSGDMYFTNTSIDYPSGFQISITRGQIFFVNCHIESFGTTPVFQNNVSTTVVNFTNCWLLQNQTTGPDPFITINGAVSITGGRLTAGDATSPVIQVNAGGSLNCVSVFLQYNGATLFNLVSGCFYTISTIFPIQLNGSSTYSSFYTSNNVSANTFYSRGGSFLGGASVTLTTLNVWVSLATTSNSGLYIFRDDTLGGTASFMADSSAGATTLSNGITGFAMNFGGVAGQMSVRVTSGAVPRTIRWTLLQIGF
jgi:hypothetical protein